MKRNDAGFREVRRLDAQDMVASTISAARQYLVTHPTHGPAWLIYSDSLCSMARYSEARVALRRAARLCPPTKIHIVHARLGHLYKQKGAFRIAERWYRRAVDVAPQDASYHIYLGALLSASGRLSEAEAVHRRATRCKEGCIDEALLNLGLVLRALERYQEARTCFVRAIALDPEYKDAHEALADVEHVIGRPRKA